MTTWLDYLVLTLATAFLILVIGIERARAEDNHFDRFWADKAFSEDHARHKNTPRYRPAHRHIQKRTYTPPVYGYVREPERAPIRVQQDVLSDVQCFPMLEGLSTEHHTEDAAYADAVKDWRARTRFKYGERMATWDDSVEKRRQCVQSSINQTVTGKIAEAVGGSVGVLWRCEVSAKPCQHENRYGEDQK